MRLDFPKTIHTRSLRKIGSLPQRLTTRQFLARKVEPIIKGLEFERMVAVLPSGDILSKDGDVDQIVYDGLEVDRISGSTITHNHPHGFPLTNSDINFALQANLAEIRAVAPNGATYSMRRPLPGWPEGKIIKDWILRCEDNVDQQIQNRHEKGQPPWSNEEIRLIYWQQLQDTKPIELR